MKSHNQSSTRAAVSPQLAFGAITISIIGPLTASALQAGPYMAGMGDSSIAKFASLTLAAAIIFSGVIVGALAGKVLAQRHYGAFAGAAVVWLGILAFSTMTSSASILNSANETIQRQVSAGSETKAIQQSIDANMATIASLQESIDSRDPKKWAGQRSKWANQIAGIQSDNQSLMRRMQSAETRGAGSSVAQSFARLEKYGITQTRIALLAAILLDAIPFITSLILSLLGETRRQEQAPGKRRATTPNLRAVA